MQEQNLKKNSVLNVIKTIAGIIFPLITFPYISRVLMPENVGKVNFGMAYRNYFSMIASLGVTTYAIRECSVVRSNKDALGKRASEIFSINVCTTIAAYILLAFSLIAFRELDSYRLLIIIQSTTILFTTLGTDWLNLAMEDFKYITLRTVTFQIVSLILMFIFVRNEGDYLKYAAISVFSASGANVANIFYRKRFCKVTFTTNMQWKTHFKPILLLFVMILAQTIFSSADVTMLGIMKSDYEVGIYSTASKIENIISQVVSSLAWVLMPRMSLYFAEGDYSKINAMLKKAFALLVGIGLPFIAGVCALAKEIVVIIGGESYLEAAEPLVFLMFAFAFSLIGGSFLGNMILLPAKKEKTYMIVCCITAVVNVSLNYLLIPYWGAKAAAFTTAISSLLIMIMLLITKDKRIRLDYIKQVSLSPIIGSVVLFAYCKIIGMLVSNLLIRTVICVMGSIVLYGIVLYLMKNIFFTEVLNFIKRRRGEK